MVEVTVVNSGSVGATVDSGGTRGAQAATTLAALNDVDASSVADGSILMFNSATSKFTTTNSIEPTTGGTITINGGNF